MIQRIQSIYLFLAAVASFVMGFVPLGAIVNQQTLATTMFGGQQSLPLMILGLLTGVIALASIFLFKNRKLQLKIVRSNAILVGVFIGLCIYFLAINMVTKIDLPRPGIVFPLFSILFNVLAMRGIVADEQLIKSMDRLR